MNDKQQWFEAQCREQGICAEDIFAVGDYATNKEGDFLYSLKNDAGEDEMQYIVACDLLDCESNYAEWLLWLMKKLEDESQRDDEVLTRPCRTKTPRALAQVFRECICRNAMLTEKKREELRKTPVYGVLEPAQNVDSRMGEYLGLYDETNVNHVVLPDEVEAAKGYRFALKVVDLEAFVEQYAYIRKEGQHGPFQILADLEKSVAKAWKEKQEVFSRYAIYMYDDPIPEDGAEVYHNSALFLFSHFEVENELDENYRTIYACYKEEYYL